MNADIFTSLNTALFSKSDWFLPQYKSTCCDQVVFRLTMSLLAQTLPLCVGTVETTKSFRTWSKSVAHVC
jgi:hypothetical protein